MAKVDDAIALRDDPLQLVQTGGEWDNAGRFKTRVANFASIAIAYRFSIQWNWNSNRPPRVDVTLFNRGEWEREQLCTGNPSSNST
ncbi:hypothetical protein MesoLjLb_51850 [Mesorhizobium sp. L-8-3]|nr:hypothetical protein MesoLjLb_51850 [Mesorhizobium sp. L-8-3]